MHKGWFSIPGVQQGDRSLVDQMLGLQRALDAVRGKQVLDLGTAEGLIAIECVKAGAAHVTGMEFNPPIFEAAQRERERLSAVEQEKLLFVQGDVADWAANEDRGSVDVVLALAIIHKLSDPDKALRACAQSARELVVFRLPKRSRGTFLTKHYGVFCDVNRSMSSHGFRLEHSEPGPFSELVQYWRRA